MLEGETVEEQYLYDVGTGVMLFGVPDLYFLTKAVYDKDMDAFAYYSAVAAGVHGTWYAAYRGVRAWDLARHGGKNIAGMSYHGAIQGKGPLATMAIRAALTPAAIGAGAYVAYKGFRNRYAAMRETAGNDMVVHPSGAISFRNPITGF